MMIGRRTPRLLPARLRGLAAATLALAALVVGLGAAPAIAAVAPGKGAISVSPAFAADAVASQSVIATLGDSLAMANEVLTSIRPMTLAGFKPGNIISDRVFYNNGTMSEAQIQEFLNSKVPRCQSGYVCLRDFRQDTSARAASAMCSAYAPANGESAARIIWRVSQACGINPQVILVTLQKEQGLVTHTWPSDYRYRAAMGQGCPDTAACDTAYYGFFNQVYGAAAQFKRYSNPPGTSNYFNWYAPGKTWGLRFHPNVACGSTPVFVENQATANLYYFTPYQPNPAAIAAGYAEANDACSSYGNRNFYNYFTDWFGSTQDNTAQSVAGAVDSVASGPGEIWVSGWALDATSAASISVAVTINSVTTKAVADQPRNDLAPHYPGLGINHGYRFSIAPPVWGDVDVCVRAMNAGGTAEKTLECTRVFAQGGSPLGSVDGMTTEPGTVTVSGWAFDPDTLSPIEVHVYVGANGSVTKADKTRNDIGNAYPAYGANHGYAATVSAPAGYQTVCVYGINVKSGGNILLAPCQQTFVRAARDPGNPPFGSLDSFDVQGNTVTMSGWALDADTPDSIGVHVYVGASGSTHKADKLRRDIGKAYPGYGEAHGFSIQRTLPPGGEQVCVYAINDGAGSNTVLGCRFLAPAASRPPVGNIDTFDVKGDKLTVRGWALDSDTPNSIAVHAYVGGSGSTHKADKPRRDIAAAYPGYGEAHGFSFERTLPPGGEQVCVYAINDGAGSNTALICRFAKPETPTAPPPPQSMPFGSIDGVSFANGRVSVTGWAIDPDTAESISVHVYVGGAGYAFTADSQRADIDRAYPGYGPLHGFSAAVPVVNDGRTACVYAINDGPGGHTLLGCKPF